MTAKATRCEFRDQASQIGETMRVAARRAGGAVLTARPAAGVGQKGVACWRT